MMCRSSASAVKYGGKLGTALNAMLPNGDTKCEITGMLNAGDQKGHAKRRVQR